MNKQTLQTNTAQNFILRGFNSIQVGIYLLISAFLLKSLLDGFLSDVSMLGMMSIEIIETVGFALVLFVFVFSGIAVFFSSRRRLKKSGFKLWNKKTWTHLAIYVLWCVTGIALLFYQKADGYSMYLAISFLFMLGLTLALLNSQRKKPLYLLAVMSIGLAVISYLIPSYWYSSLLIMGGAFIVYGIMIRK
jgi:threonine/homoserine efflux transporter RhtA